MAAKASYHKYNYFKAIEKNYLDAKEKEQASEKKELKIIQDSEENTRKASKTNKEINDKLKEDEKAIDNDSVTQSERERFISKYENR